jgi:hypothetical protein
MGCGFANDFQQTLHDELFLPIVGKLQFGDISQYFTYFAHGI